MAGTITHAYFAIDVYEKLDKNIRNNLLEYKENLKTYGQGHDIFFFCTKKGVGNYMHKNNTRKFFTNMVNYVYNNKLEYNYEIMSFLYGYICHYVLDSTVHPYVSYKCGIFNKKDKNTYKYNAKHSNMESYIDCYMAYTKENIEPCKFKVHKFCFNTKVSKNLCKMIDCVYKQTYDYNNMSVYLRQGLFNMKILYKLLRYDPHKIKKKIYKVIDFFTSKKRKKTYPISYAYTLNNNEYYLNLNKNKWNHPKYIDEVYTYSFLELYENALDEAVKIINDVNDILYNNKPISNLNSIFKNLSFSSGKDCKDKTKNKYFEN